MRWSSVVLLAVLGWSPSVRADVKFTMLYITNPVIYTDTPFQIVWTGAQGLVNVTLVDAVDGSKTLVQSKDSGTTFNWVPAESLNGHRGSLVITDGLSSDTTAVFSFKDRSEEGVVSSSTSSMPQSSPTQTSLTTATSPGTTLQAATTSVSTSQIATSLQSPTVLTLAPTPVPAPDSNDSRLSLGTQVGIAIGAILLTAAGAAMLLYLLWFRKRQLASEAPQKMNRESGEVVGGHYGQASPYGSNQSVSELYGSSPSVAVLRKPVPIASCRSVPEMESTLAGSPVSPISTTSTALPPSVPPTPSRTHHSEDVQGSEERINMVEDKSLRSDMLREYHRH